jgi:GNAT superfamily N-acetyltransferase
VHAVSALGTDVSRRLFDLQPQRTIDLGRPGQKEVEQSALMRLSRPQIEQAAEVASRAFHGNSLTSRLFPREFNRLSLSALYRFSLNYGLLYGETCVTSPTLEGIAVWLPPGQTGMPVSRVLRAGGWSLPLAISPLLLLRFLPVVKVSAAAHKRHAPFPHWYLFLLCVAPEHQRKGYGSALLDSMLSRIDRQHMPCYLETTEERNLAFYEHHGFRVAEMGRVPGKDVTVWAMLRDKAG